MKKIFYIFFFSFLFLFLESIYSQPKKKNAQVQLDQDSYQIKKRKRSTRKKRPRLSRKAIVAKSSEGKLIKGLEKVIKFLEKTVNKLKKGSQKRLVMLDRILKLLSEQASYISNQEYLTFDKKWIRWEKSGKKGKEPKISNRSSKRYWKDILSYTKLILNEYKEDKKLSEIFFLRATAYEMLGKKKSSIKEFKALIKNFPSSASAGKAYYFLGEYSFDEGDFSGAKTYYKSVLKFKRSIFYGWALFKLGWCAFNYEDYEKSLEYWKKTVAYAKKYSDQKGARFREEALRDMITAYSELKATDAGLAYFRKNGGKSYAIKFLRSLGSNFADNGEIEDALRVWQILLENYPNSLESFDTKKDIIELYFADNLYHKLWRELDILGEKFDKKSSWAKENDKKDVKKYLRIRKELFLFFPKKVHSLAQKKQEQDLFIQAKKGYELYLKYYRGSKEDPEILEYLADIEYEQGHLKIAGDMYKKIALLPKKKSVIYSSSGKVIKSIRKRVARNMLDTFSKIFIPQLKEMMKLKPDYKKEAKELSIEAKDFVESCKIYTKIFPKDKKKEKECDVFLAEVYYRFRDRQDAKKELWNVAYKYPSFKEGPLAVDQLIPLYADNEKGLSDISKKILAIKSYSQGPLGKKIRNLLRKMRIEKIEATEDPGKKAEKYLLEAKNNPNDPDVDKFWYNSAINFLKANSFLDALASFKKVVSSYPNSPGFLPSLLQLAKFSETKMDFKSSINYYLRYAKKAPKGNDAIVAYQKACIFMIAIDHPKAYQESILFAKKHSKFAKLVIERLIKNLEISKKKELLEKVIYQVYLANFPIRSDQRILAIWKLYKFYPVGSQKRKTIASSIMSIFKKEGGAGGEALRAVGEIIFNSLQITFQKSLTYKLQGGSVEKLQASIVQIQNILQALEKSYEKLFLSKDSYWSIAGFYQLGYAYEMFSKQLRNPPNIPGFKKRVLKKELKSSVDLVVKKARDFYSNGLQVVRRFLIHSEWSNKIFDAVNRAYLRNKSFDELIIDPDYLASEIPQSLSLKLRNK